MLLLRLAFVDINAVVKYPGTDLPATQSAYKRFAVGVLVIARLLPGNGPGQRQTAVMAVALVGALIGLRPGLHEVTEGHRA